VNAVLFAVEAAGRDVKARPPRAERSTTPSTTGAWVDGRFVELLIYEHYDMVPLPPLPKRRKETTEEAIARMYRKKVEYRSNGRLTIQVGGRGSGSPKWTDRRRRRIEELLHEVVDEVVRYVDGAPAREAERRRLEEEARKAELRRGEEMLAQVHEAARLEDLRRRAEAWARARAMLAFVDAVEQDAGTRGAAAAEGESVKKWVVWARNKAREEESRCVRVDVPFEGAAADSLRVEATR
jgi:hypothetical protein